LFTSIVGPSVFLYDENGKILIEDMLLQSGGKLEMSGSINIVRFDPKEKTTYEYRDNSTYMLYDVVKSDFARTEAKKCVSQFAFDNYNDYKNAFFNKFCVNCREINLNDDEARQFTYMKLKLDKVTE
jgi:hypothetical protein